MGLDLEYIDGQTPLDEEEKDGLLIPTIATRGELDEFEQQNIEEAILWTLRRTFKLETILSEEFIRRVHKHMYGEVWAWAGEFRKTNKNIGIDRWQVPVELRNLLDDTKFWIANKTYSADEITIRFKHRIVSIHCFPNGNGRHSRLLADIISEQIFNQPVYTWGAAANLVRQNDGRINYLNAIRSADKGDIGPLILFSRS